jgi:hypothetical protein
VICDAHICALSFARSAGLVEAHGMQAPWGSLSAIEKGRNRATPGTVYRVNQKEHGSEMHNNLSA